MRTVANVFTLFLLLPACPAFTRGDEPAAESALAAENNPPPRAVEPVEIQGARPPVPAIPVPREPADRAVGMPIPAPPPGVRHPAAGAE